MRAGELKRRITLQRQDTTQDNYGQPSQHWTDALSTWAAIRTVTGKEIYAASGFTSEVSHTITIRFPDVEVRSSMRVQYGDRSFVIQAVSDPDESQRMLTLLCLERNEGA